MLVRRTLTALAIGAVFAGATAAAAPASEGTTKAADRALHIRSQALNDLHGDAALNALAVRSEGMNSYARTLQAAPPVTSTPASTSFAWDDFATGMAAAFGLILLMGGIALAVRTGTRRRVRISS